MSIVGEMFEEQIAAKDAIIKDLLEDYWYLLQNGNPQNGGKLWPKELERYEAKFHRIVKEEKITF